MIITKIDEVEQTKLIKSLDSHIKERHFRL